MRTEKLGNLAEFRNGLNYTDADNGSGLAVVGVSDFKDEVVIDTGNLPQLSLSALSKPDALIQQGDILFVRSNGNRELIGRSVYVNAEPAMPTSHSGFTIRCRFRDPRCHPRYYAYLFRGSIIRQILSAQGGGTNISNLNQQILAELNVPVPDFPMQERIADILSAYDDLIEVNQRRVAILEDMARRLFDEWFVHFRYPGHEAVPLVETELGMVPEGWTPRTLSWWTEEVRDTVSPQQVEPLVAYVGLEHLPRRSTTLVEVGKAQDVTSSKLKFKAGDILFGKIRPYFHKVALMPFSGVCSTDAICIRPTNPKRTALILGLTSSDAFVAHAVATSNGTKMPRADWKVLKNYPLPEAPEPLLDAFERTVHPIVDSAANLAAQNNRLRAARDLLLPKLISGQIDVSVAEQTFAEAAE